MVSSLIIKHSLQKVKTILTPGRLPFLPIPVRTLTPGTYTNFLFSRKPCMSTSFADRFVKFYFHDRKYILKSITCQVIFLQNR